MKIQHGGKVKQLNKIFFVEHVFSQTQQCSKFMDKTKQIYNLDTFSQQTQKHKQKVKKEFGNSSDLQQQILLTEPMTRSFLNFA